MLMRLYFSLTRLIRSLDCMFLFLPYDSIMKGSYNVMPARLLHLTYAQYLRYCRDRLGAELIGKNHKYVMAYFNNDKNVNALIDLLNTRMAYIINEKENPYTYKVEGKEVVSTPFEEVSNENN